MSQHDFDIANQTAPNSRADINLALKALASNSSGTVAPTTTYANMTYYNTATNILYKRNEADSAWITLGTIDETAGTFTPSGERALATQAQAEAGTDNATLMTPLRSAQAIAALATFSIADGSITTAKLANSAVTGAKLGIALGSQSLSFPSGGGSGSISVPFNTFSVWNLSTSVNISTSLRGSSTTKTIYYEYGSGGTGTIYWHYFT